MPLNKFGSHATKFRPYGDDDDDEEDDVINKKYVCDAFEGALSKLSTQIKSLNDNVSNNNEAIKAVLKAVVENVEQIVKYLKLQQSSKIEKSDKKQPQ